VMFANILNMKQFPGDLSELGNGYITMKMVDAIAV